MSSITERLGLVVATLRAALSAYGIRLARPRHTAWIGTTFYAAIPTPEPLPRLAPDLWILFWNRLGRAQRRFQALYDAWKAGTLKPLRPHKASAQAAPSLAPTTPDTTPTARPRLPTTFGWVTRRAEEAGPAAGLLHDLIHQEETERFVTEVPRAGRLLRPLCRALGLKPPPYLRLPPRPRKPRPRRPRPRRPERPSFNDPRIKWRPGEKEAAMAFVKKYGRG